MGYEGNQTYSHIMTTSLIIGFLFCTCFPIWPNFLKVFVWYLSVTILLFLFLLITIRGLLFLLIWVLGYNFWFLPNLFDEKLGFVDSFQPLYSFESTKSGQLPYRIAVALSLSSFCWWAVTQPSEFDIFLRAQQDFINGIYNQTLLPEMSQQEKENIDKPKMQSLDEILKRLGEDEEKVEFRSEEEQINNLLDNLVNNEEEIIDNEDS